MSNLECPCWQDAERRQAETRAKQQQRQREVEAAQQEAHERRQQLADQKLSKLAGTSACTMTPHTVSGSSSPTLQQVLQQLFDPVLFKL